MSATDIRLFSQFRNKWDNGLTKEGEADPSRLPDITQNEFFEGVRSGRWKQRVDYVRQAIDDKSEYDKRKAGTQAVTIWGTFLVRRAANSDIPSGLMSVDLDHLSESELKRVFNTLKQDPYVYACFRSIGGKGLCVIFKVDHTKWLESFEGIRIYLTETHGLVMGWDSSVSDICRLRFVSYDPETHVNYKAQLFKKYPRKEPKKEKPHNYIHTESDIQHILEQIHSKAIDITGGYKEWYKIGWALISKYGEEARGYFHEVSQYNANYTSEECDTKFKYLIETRPHSITIGTFYYYCKLAGISIMTPTTKEVAGLATASKRNKVSPKSALEKVTSMTDIPESVARPIIEQIYASDIEIDLDETLFDKLESFLKTNYSLQYNEITHYIEADGVKLLDRELNDIYIAAAKAFDNKVSKDNVFTTLNSSSIPSYNPLHSFFVRYRDRKPSGVIDALCDTIQHNMPGNYVQFFMRKFLLGLIGSAFGKQCPLMPILCGPPNSGKTQFFRRLLPEELHTYYGECKFNKPGDDELLMCKKWILMSDDLDTAFLENHTRFKNLTDAHEFNVRKPYGKAHEDLARLAMLCGTSNELVLIFDPTGNRRIVPIEITGFDFEAYNVIDKIDLLMEAYWLYKEGESGDLTPDQVQFLKKHTAKFVDISLERDIIEKYFAIPTIKEDAMLMSQGEIMVYLGQMTGIKNLRKKIVSMEMKSLGFPYSDGDWYPAERKSKRGFYLYKTTLSDSSL